MVRRIEDETGTEIGADPGPIDRDERLGEAIEAYLALAEAGPPPDPDDFAAGYPDLGDDLRAALEGLALVRGLVGDSEGPGHRLESGRRIAGYRIVRELGRGGMGTVYEAVHVGLDRPVALKVLGTHAAPDSNGRRRFLNEARTAAGLHHTHIVPVFDVGQVGGLCYYAMQRIEGSGLDRVLRHLRRDRAVAAGSSFPGATPTNPLSGWFGRSPRRPSGLDLDEAPDRDDETATWLGQGPRGSRGEASRKAGIADPKRDDDEPPPFDPPRGSAYYRWVAEVGREAAEALAHAHRRGIVHRDIKPSNLLVDARGVVWVADFGLARRLADPGLTHHDSLLGTPRYMSPEQARTGPIDGRTDVYSLGATLYELLTLRPPFEGRTAVELIDQIGSREPSPPRQYDARIPRDLETIVLKALAKRPVDRYASAAELAEDLDRFRHFEPVKARRISPIGRLWRAARRHPGTSLVSAAAAAAILAIATLAHIGVVHERDQAVAARAETQAAMRKTEAANRATQAAMREQLWREASLVRYSTLPNRRATGLGRLKDAAALGPEPALKAKLRDVAVEFLVLRDVEARPGFPTGPARGVVFGPQGGRLAALSDDGQEFSLWDVAGRRRLEAHRLGAEGPGPPARPPVASANANANAGGGRPAPSIRREWGLFRLAAAGQCMAAVRPEGQGLRLFDAASGAPIRDLEAPGRRIVALLAATGIHRFVTVDAVAARDSDQDGFEVRLDDPEHLDRPIATLVRLDTGLTGRDFPLVAVSPDGKTVATARVRDTSVALWAAEDGRSLGAIEAQAELTALALGPDGLLATAGGGTVRLWDLDTKTPLPSLSPYQGFVRVLRFNPKGTLLAVAGLGADVEIWDPSANAVVAVLPMPERAEDLAFAPDGRTLAAAGPGAMTSVWTVVDPVTRVQLSGFNTLPTSLAFRGDGLLAMASWKGSVRFWRPGQCPTMAQPVPSCSLPDTSADHPDGRPASLAFDDRDRLVAVDPDVLRYWPHLLRLPLPPRRLELPGNPGGWWKLFPAPAARASGGKTLFLARGAQIFAWHSGEPDRCQPLTLPVPLEPADVDPDHARSEPTVWRSVAAGPAGDRLYLIDNAGDVHVLALSGTRATRLSWSLPGDATSLAVSPDGATLALGDRHGLVAVVDTARGAVRSRLSKPTDETEGRTWALAFAPDSRTLAVGTQQGHVELWSLADPTAPLLRLPAHRGFVTALAFDAQGRHLASGGSDKLVEVWDLERIRADLEGLGLAW